MLNNVRDAVVSALTGAGLNAAAAYPHSAVPETDTLVRVGIRQAENRSGGFGDFLGLRNDPEKGAVEVDGMRCGVTLALDVYAPLTASDAAGDCIGAFDAACEALAAGLPGLHLRTLRCGSPAPDPASRMMLLRCEAEGSALLVLEGSDGEAAAFRDFVLRGELKV